MSHNAISWGRVNLHRWLTAVCSTCKSVKWLFVERGTRCADGFWYLFVQNQFSQPARFTGVTKKRKSNDEKQIHVKTFSVWCLTSSNKNRHLPPYSSRTRLLACITVSFLSRPPTVAHSVAQSLYTLLLPAAVRSVRFPFVPLIADLKSQSLALQPVWQRPRQRTSVPKTKTYSAVCQHCPNSAVACFYECSLQALGTGWHLCLSLSHTHSEISADLCFAFGSISRNHFVRTLCLKSSAAYDLLSYGRKVCRLASFSMSAKFTHKGSSTAFGRWWKSASYLRPLEERHHMFTVCLTD